MHCQCIWYIPYFLVYNTTLFINLRKVLRGVRGGLGGGGGGGCCDQERALLNLDPSPPVNYCEILNMNNTKTRKLVPITWRASSSLVFFFVCSSFQKQNRKKEGETEQQQQTY